MLNFLWIFHQLVLVFLSDSGLSVTTPVEGVFHASVGRYKLNFYDAQRVCEIRGATLATYDQLYDAWSAGLERCAYVNHFVLVRFFLSNGKRIEWSPIDTSPKWRPKIQTS